MLQSYEINMTGVAAAGGNPGRNGSLRSRSPALSGSPIGPYDPPSLLERPHRMDIEDAGLGPKLAWKPAQPPRREALTGRYVRLEPVDASRHAADLFELSHGPQGDPAIWIYLGYGPFPDFAGFNTWLIERAASSDPLFYAVVDVATGRAAGMASYLRIVPADGVIETGHIWFT